MKNNKAVTYVLLAAVAAIWGWVIFKLVSGGSSDEINNNAFNTNVKTETSNAQLDTFSLIADYRDPFVIKYVSVNDAEDLNLEEDKQKNEKIKPRIDWPSIKYGGTVKSKTSEKRIALVNIEEKPYLLSVGETAQEVLITAIYSDSLMVKFKSEEKVIVKSKAVTEESAKTPEKKKK